MIALSPSSKVIAEKLAIEMDQSERNYLHVIEGTQRCAT